MAKLKIALFMYPLLTEGGGAEKYFIELANNLSEKKDVVIDVVTMDVNFFKFFTFLLNFYWLRPFARVDALGREKEADIRKRLGRAKWVNSSLKDLKKNLEQYDVIYSKNEIVDLALLKIVGYDNLPPVIVGVHTPVYYPQTKSFSSKLHNFLYGGRFYRFLLDGVALVHASNKFTADFFDKRFAVKTQLIPYPFSWSKWEMREIKKVTNKYCALGKFNIVFVGRLGEQKGADLLPGIVDCILQNNLSRKVCLNIFGRGEDIWNKKIEELADKYSWVRYWGHVEHRLMPLILSKQNLLISLSRWEVLPYNILEAQAAGLPVLAFNIPGPADIIKNGQTGFLVKDETEMEEKLVEFINGRFSFNKFLIEKNIKKNFSPTVIYPKLYSMLTEALNENKKT